MLVASFQNGINRWVVIIIRGHDRHKRTLSYVSVTSVRHMTFPFRILISATHYLGRCFCLSIENNVCFAHRVLCFLMKAEAHTGGAALPLGWQLVSPWSLLPTTFQEARLGCKVICRHFVSAEWIYRPLQTYWIRPRILSCCYSILNVYLTGALAFYERATYSAELYLNAVR